MKIEARRESLDPLREICAENIRFVDDDGKFRIYKDALADSFAAEVTRIRILWFYLLSPNLFFATLSQH